MDNIIKHIVISGGGPTGFTYYGILKETNRNGLWNIENIKSIYGTSMGAIIGTILVLNYDWETIDDYLIKRPWNNIYKFDMYSIIDSYKKRGIFNIKVIEDTFLPLFKGKDIPINVTMKDFYELTNIELHLFATEINDFKLADISYKTHPDWTVVEAVYCSACLPVIFSPYLKEEECYCDGGAISNYPLEYCIKNGADVNEILGIRRKSKEISNNALTDSSSLLDFILVIINKTSSKMLSIIKYPDIKHEYVIESDLTSMYNIYSFVNSPEERLNYINAGVELVKSKSTSIILT
jgi:predicted acylesterase/phospholipase RssA